MIIGDYKLKREDKWNITLSKLQTIKGKDGERQEYVFIGYYRTVKGVVEKILKDDELSLVNHVSTAEFLKELDKIHTLTIKNLTQALKQYDYKTLEKKE